MLKSRGLKRYTSRRSDEIHFHSGCLLCGAIDLLQPLISAVGYSKLFGLTALRVWMRECIGWVEWVIVESTVLERRVASMDRNVVWLK